MSLLEMITFVLGEFAAAYQTLATEIVAVGTRAIDPTLPLNEEDRDRIINSLNYLYATCGRLLLPSAINRFGRMFVPLLSTLPLTYSQILDQLLILKEAIEDDIKTEFFYHYRRDKVLMLRVIDRDWAPTLTAFPSAKKEIEEGVDCHALEHHTASVFHMMRVAELGMRALARERQVSFPKHLSNGRIGRISLNKPNQRLGRQRLGFRVVPKRTRCRRFIAARADSCTLLRIPIAMW